MRTQVREEGRTPPDIWEKTTQSQRLKEGNISTSEESMQGRTLTLFLFLLDSIVSIS